jgi:hypothetical protein
VVAKYPPREHRQASSSNGDKASASKDQVTTTANIHQEVGQHALGSKASTRERTKEPMAVKHPPGFPRRPSMCQGRSEDAHYDKVSLEGSHHDTLGSKASAKEETNNNDDKVSTKGSNDGQASVVGDSDSDKASATKDKRRRQGQVLQDRPLRVEHRHTQA